MLLRFLVLVAAFGAVAGAAAGPGLPLVSGEGQCKPAAQITSFLEKSKVGSSAASPLIGVVDLSGDGSGCALANAILTTSFPEAQAGICLDGTSDSSAVVMLARYDTMFSSKFCGSKAADFLGSLSDALVVILPPQQDVLDVLSGHDQTVRRLANVLRQRGANAVKDIFFLSTKESTGTSEDVAQAFEAIWAEVCEGGGGGGAGKSVAAPHVSVLVVNVKDSAAVSSTKTAISSSAAAAATASVESRGGEDGASLVGKIVEGWGKVAAGVPRPLYSTLQRQSVHAIESAYAVGLAQSEAAFNQWQARVGSGKVVGKFGARVQELLENVHARFMEQTKGSVSVRERAQRARQLRENVESVAGTLFRQQLSLLQTLITNRFRNSLIGFAVAGKEDEAAGKEEEQLALRKALFEFRTLALELEVESLGLVSTTAQTDLSASLQTLATEFPESSFGRLEAVKKLERETKRPKKSKGGKGGGRGAKGKRAVNVGLNLVGMLRPPGYGNLQGFVGYSTALLGLPFEILMGVQNDGDSPEVMGEDREYPLLRLQPKVSFDIDI